MTQVLSAQGAPQVTPMLAQLLNAIPTGPKRTHSTKTIAVIRRRRLKRIASSLLFVKIRRLCRALRLGAAMLAPKTLHPFLDQPWHHE
jgi:hypothetical protein